MSFFFFFKSPLLLRNLDRKDDMPSHPFPVTNRLSSFVDKTKGAELRGSVLTRAAEIISGPERKKEKKKNVNRSLK